MQTEQNVKRSGKGRAGLRIAALAILGLLILGATAAYLSLTYKPTVGTGPAGPSVAPAAFAKTWSTNRVLVVGLGDSVTAGFGARKGYSYFDRLLANPSDEYEDMRGIALSKVLPNLTATNLAVSGSVSQHLLGNQLPLLPKAESNVTGIIAITTGGNDVIHNYGKSPPKEHAMYGATWEQAQPWIENYGMRLRQILDGLEERFPGGCHVFIATIYDPSDAKGDIDKAGLPAWADGLRILAAYNAKIKEEAARRKNVHVVDMYSEFLGHGIHSGQPWAKYYRREDPHYWYFTNLEDPNERGYDAIRRLFLNEMARVLGTN